MSVGPNTPQNPPAPGSGDRDSGPTNDDIEEIKKALDKIQEDVSSEDNEKENRDPERAIATFEDLHSIFVRAGIFTGILGLLITAAADATGFIPIFVIGLAFLAYSYATGLPA